MSEAACLRCAGGDRSRSDLARNSRNSLGNLMGQDETQFRKFPLKFDVSRAPVARGKKLSLSRSGWVQGERREGTRTWRTGRLSGKRTAPGRRPPMQPETERDDASTAREGASRQRARAQAGREQWARGRAHRSEPTTCRVRLFAELAGTHVLLCAVGCHWIVVDTRPAKLLPVVVSET